jgi:hypothetical protein
MNTQDETPDNKIAIEAGRKVNALPRVAQKAMNKELKNGWEEIGETIPKLKSKSPTRCAIELCHEEDALVDIVERWLPGGRIKITVDCFGFADLIAIYPALDKLGVTFIQVTANNGSSRVRKIIGDPILRDNARRVLAAGNRIVVWDYRDRKVGNKKRRQLCVRHITLDDVQRRQRKARVRK